MNNDFKQKLQEREFLALKDEPRVILKWATGCGKSKMTIDLINHAVKNRLQKSGLHHICPCAQRNYHPLLFSYVQKLTVPC